MTVGLGEGVGVAVGCTTILLVGCGEAVGVGVAARRGLASCVRALPLQPVARSDKVIKQAKSMRRGVRAPGDDFILL